MWRTIRPRAWARARLTMVLGITVWIAWSSFGSAKTPSCPNRFVAAPSPASGVAPRLAVIAAHRRSRRASTRAPRLAAHRPRRAHRRQIPTERDSPPVALPPKLAWRDSIPEPTPDPGAFIRFHPGPNPPTPRLANPRNPRPRSRRDVSYSPGAWRATKPPVPLLPICQREPVPPRPLVSNQTPPTFMKTCPGFE